MTHRIAVFTAVALSALACAPARADMWEDYAPAKEPWTVTQIRVSPSKLDDYLAGLHKGWLPGMELAKKNGEVVDYHILMNTSEGAAGANVILMVKWTDFAALAPSKDRDLKMMEEERKSVPKSQEQQTRGEFDKYRVFLDEGVFYDIGFPK